MPGASMESFSSAKWMHNHIFKLVKNWFLQVPINPNYEPDRMSDADTRQHQLQDQADEAQFWEDWDYDEDGFHPAEESWP